MTERSRRLVPFSIIPSGFLFETPPRLTIGEDRAANFDSLWNEMEAEATPSKESEEIVRALLRLLFYKPPGFTGASMRRVARNYRKATRAASDGIFGSLWRSIFVRQLRFRIMRNFYTLTPITSGQ